MRVELQFNIIHTSRRRDAEEQPSCGLLLGEALSSFVFSWQLLRLSSILYAECDTMHSTLSWYTYSRQARIKAAQRYTNFNVMAAILSSVITFSRWHQIQNHSDASNQFLSHTKSTSNCISIFWPFDVRCIRPQELHLQVKSTIDISVGYTTFICLSNVIISRFNLSSAATCKGNGDCLTNVSGCIVIYDSDAKSRTTQQIFFDSALFSSFFPPFEPISSAANCICTRISRMISSR